MKNLKLSAMPSLMTAVLAAALFSGCVVPIKPTPAVPNTPPPKLDFARIAEFANAANLVYQTDNVIKTAYPNATVYVRDLPKNQCRYFLVIDDKLQTQIISIRGTSNEQNVWVDADTIKIPDPYLGINVHLGFLRATSEMYDDIKPLLKKGYSTRVTGHSLGGAMACILMMDFMKDGTKIDQVITFGQPKVTNEDGGKKYENDLYLRVIDNEDIVPRVPPSDLVFDLSGTYQHFGPEIILLSNGTYSYSPVPIPVAVASDNQWKNINLENINDHKMENYLSRINALK